MTKYALSTGIQKVEIDESYGRGRGKGPREADEPFVEGDFVYAKSGTYHIQLRVGRDVFFDRESAVQAAKQMALQKAKSLEKQINRIRGLADVPKWK